MLEHDRPGHSFVAVDGSRWGELILPAPEEASKRTDAGLRVLAVTGFFYSIELLSALLGYERAHPARLYPVAVATDDAVNADARIGLRKRIWKHYDQSERVAIEAAAIETALQSGLPVYTGEFKIEWFYQAARNLAAPTPSSSAAAVRSSTAGFSARPRYGVYNFHLTISPMTGAAPAQRSRGGRRVLDRPPNDRRGGRRCDRPAPDHGGRCSRTHVRDPKRFYEKLKGVVGPMATILIEELARLGDGGPDGRIMRIDFEPRLPDGVKTHLREPIA